MSPPKDAVEEAARIGRREAIERVAGVSIASASTLALGWGMVRGRHAFELEEVVGPRARAGRARSRATSSRRSRTSTSAPSSVIASSMKGSSSSRAIRPDLVVATGDLVDIDKDAIGRSRCVSSASARATARTRSSATTITTPGAARRGRAHPRVEGEVLHNESVRVRTDDGGGFALLGVDDLQGRLGQLARHRGPGSRPRG